jgi:hypothetical protein
MNLKLVQLENFYIAGKFLCGKKFNNAGGLLKAAIKV